MYHKKSLVSFVVLICSSNPELLNELLLQIPILSLYQPHEDGSSVVLAKRDSPRVLCETTFKYDHCCEKNLLVPTDPNFDEILHCSRNYRRYLGGVEYNILTIWKDAHRPSWKEVNMSIECDICICPTSIISKKGCTLIGMFIVDMRLTQKE